MTIDPQKKKTMNKHEFPLLLGYLFLLLCVHHLIIQESRNFTLIKRMALCWFTVLRGLLVSPLNRFFWDETVNKNPRSFKKSITNMVTDLTHKNPSTHNHQTIGKWSQKISTNKSWVGSCLRTKPLPPRCRRPEETSGIQQT